MLVNGEQVSAGPGYVQVNGVQQAEVGSHRAVGLTLQSWHGPATGTINGLAVFNTCLAATPVTPNFSWDALDDHFSGNAEAMLQANPSPWQGDIDPALTGTVQPLPALDTLTGGLFPGTHHGLTITVCTAGNFTLLSVVPLPVPEPATASLFRLGLAGITAAAGQRRPRS